MLDRSSGSTLGKVVTPQLSSGPLGGALYSEFLMRIFLLILAVFLSSAAPKSLFSQAVSTQSSEHLRFTFLPILAKDIPTTINFQPSDTMRSKFLGTKVISDSVKAFYVFISSEDTLHIHAKGRDGTFDQSFPVAKGYYVVVNNYTRMFLEHFSIYWRYDGIYSRAVE